MRFLAHFSSSQGNLYEVVASNEKRLIIDPGVTWAKLQKALKYDLSSIEGVCCGHFHADHSKSAEKVLEAGIDLYASKETLDALDLCGCRHSHAIEDKRRFSIGQTFECFPFSLQHDVEGALGFVIHDKSSDENLLYINDTRSVKQRFGIAFNILTICCSYDVVVLREREAAGTIDPSLAKRLLSSHMEKETTKAYLGESCCLDKCTEIWLLHCSRDNLDAEKVRREIESDFFVKTFIAGGGRGSQFSISSQVEP